MVTKLKKPAGQEDGDGVFGAIADPTRRAILDLLRHRELCAGDIARNFSVSRPAIARHVRVLRQAGLLHERSDATSRFYSLDGKALQTVDTWLSPYRLFWAARLVDLKRVVEEQMEEEEKKAKAKEDPPTRSRS